MFTHRREKYLGQNFLLETLQYLKFPTNTEKGKCAGVVQKGIESFLMDEDESCHHLNLFNADLVQIHQEWEIFGKSASYSLSAINTKHFKDFFQDILYYQEPLKYKNRLGDNVSQFTPSLITNLLCNPIISKKGEMWEMAHYFLPFFINYDLQFFFNLVKKCAENGRVAMSISSNGHRTGLGFIAKTQQWFLINANTLPVFEIQEQSLSGDIFAAHLSNNKTYRECFSVRFYSTGNHKKNMAAMLKKLNKEIVSAKCLPDKLDLEKRNKYGNGLLHLITNYNHLIFLSFLLSQPGLDPNITNNDDLTPLHIAALINHYDSAALLLRHSNIKLNLQDKKGKTPVYTSIKKGNLQLTQLLIERGADPFINCKNGTNTVTIAAKKGQLPLFETLHTKKIDLTKPDGNNKTALEYAKEYRQEKIINFFDNHVLNTSSTFFQRNPDKKRSASRPCEPLQNKKLKMGHKS